jgi:spermidine synthase
MDKLKKNFALFSVGLFAIASQTLLFREFISAFEGNDIAVGMFFGAWFLWIAFAAWLSVKCGNSFAKFADWTPLIILSYLPAFILQYLLILNIRKCAGVEVYELFPIWKMIFWSLAVNAPLSFVTGFVFPLACRWFREAGKLPVADVYVFESVGSFAGGLAVTLMLVSGFNTFLVFFVIAFILSSSFYFLRPRNYRGLAIPLILISCMVFRVDVKLIESVRIFKWTKLLPAESYNGSFQTAQAEYLYGSCNGQWTVCREGSACEIMPDPESAWKIIAVHLAQNPRAEKVLVIGSGMNLCREILRIPQISDLAWAHYDNGYVSEINKYMPLGLRIDDKRFHPLGKGDIREFLAKKKNHYDIVIVNVPDVTTSILNRYFTLEFNELVKNSIAANGLLGIRLSGGENVIGPELAFIGASAMATLGKTFSHIEIVPGDTTWLLVSDSSGLQGEPGILLKRFASNREAASFFPPEGLLSLYIPDRAQTALEKYESVKISGTSLINTDANPPAYLFGLLFSARQSGIGLTSFIEKLLGSGMIYPLMPLALLLLFLPVYILGGRGGRKMRGRILGIWVIFVAGFVSIGTVIALMYLFQTCLGSLYLNVGVVSAVFMLGLSVGAALGRYLFGGMKIESGRLLDFAVTIHVAVLFLILYPPISEWRYAYFILAFALSGMCSGFYFPAAAFLLRESGYDELDSGGMLETSDHIGAALGAFVCGVLVIPVWGVAGTLIFFMIFMFTVIPVSLLCRHGCFYAGNGDAVLKYRRAVYSIVLVSMLLLIGYSVYKSYSLFSSGSGSQPGTKQLRLPNLEAKAVKPIPEKNLADDDKIASGTPRELNMDKVKKMIKAGKLSGKEAEFYRKIE